MRPLADLTDLTIADRILNWCDEYLGPMAPYSDRDLTVVDLGPGARIERAGGHEVICVGPDEPGGILAWGYPHPDEPLGATALMELVDAMSWGAELPGPLAGIPVRVVLCADRKGAEINRRWIESRDITDWAHGHHRPLGPGCEVDYSFPINQFPHRSPNYELMAESRWLAELLKEHRPDVVGLMHNSLLGGDFTFLSHRPGHVLIEAIDRLQCRLGRPRFELPGQPGEVLIEGRFDLLGERTLYDRLLACEKNHRALKPGEVILGAASAAMFCETLLHRPLVITPEAALLECPPPNSSRHQLGAEVVWEMAHRSVIRAEALKARLTEQQAERIEAGRAWDLRFQALMDPQLRNSPVTEQWATELQVAGRLGLLSEIAGPASGSLMDIRLRLLDELPEELAFIDGLQVKNAVCSMVGRLLIAAAAKTA